MPGDSAGFQVDRTRIHWERFEDETVLIDVLSGFYYSLSPSGSELLDLVEKGCPTRMLTHALLGDSKSAPLHHEQVTLFIEQLVREGILIERSIAVAPDPSIDVSRPVYASVDEFKKPVLERYDDVRDLLLIDPVHMIDQDQGWPKT